MSLASRLGQAFRREASLSSVRNIRSLDRQRADRLGATADELNAKFALRVSKIEARVRALESEVLGSEKIG